MYIPGEKLTGKQFLYLSGMSSSLSVAVLLELFSLVAVFCCDDDNDGGHNAFFGNSMTTDLSPLSF